jgi:NUMOD3 motif
MYYVYEYIDPITNLPFYIGKGKDNRDLKHLDETYETTENKKKYAYIEGLRNKGLTPVINKIKTNLTESDAYDLETELIKKYCRRDIDPNGILTNICEDNRPPSALGRIYSDEHNKRMSESRRGDKNPNYGNKHTNEWRTQHSKRMMGENNPMFGKTHTNEQKEKWKNRKTRLGQKNTAEHRDAISKANTGKTHSDETKQKIREKRKYQLDSEETRFKKSESLKLYWKKKKGKL